MMKKITILLVLCFTVFLTHAQSRVKGSRVVTEVSEDLPSFKKLKVTDGLEITLLQSETPGFDLEMDDNLVELINMNVIDSLLYISLAKTIRSSKKLDITIRYNELKEITANAKSRVIAQSAIETEIFRGIISGNSSMQIEVKAKNASFSINESSKLELDYRGDDIKITAIENAFAKGDIDTQYFALTASGRSDIEFKGNAQESIINLNDNAEFKARAFDSDAVKVILRESAEAILSADKDILIDMADQSVLNLYGEPAITVERFSGTSKLQKED